jgi:hypothetical protein
MMHRYAPSISTKLAREPRVGHPCLVTRKEKRRGAALAVGMLLVPFLSFGSVLALYLMMRGG